IITRFIVCSWTLPLRCGGSVAAITRTWPLSIFTLFGLCARSAETAAAASSRPHEIVRIDSAPPFCSICELLEARLKETQVARLVGHAQPADLLPFSVDKRRRFRGHVHMRLRVDAAGHR